MKLPRAASLTEVEDRFVNSWRAMGSLWGVSPVMAQIHAFLYLVGGALTMDEIMERLGISRGSASMNLNKLVEWGLVRRTHHKGDRKDRYESLSDVWEIFTRVAAERKRREIDPMLGALRQCQEQLAASDDAAARDRLRRVKELHDFMAMVDRLAQRFFESQRGLKAAVALLQNEEEGG